MVVGARNRIIGKLDHGEKRRVQWPQLRSVVSKSGGKSPTTLKERSLLNFVTGCKHTLKSADTALPCSTAPGTSWSWWVTEGCFPSPKGSAGGYIIRLGRRRSVLLRRSNRLRPEGIRNVQVVHVHP